MENPIVWGFCLFLVFGLVFSFFVVKDKEKNYCTSEFNIFMDKETQKEYREKCLNKGGKNEIIQ